MRVVRAHSLKHVLIDRINLPTRAGRREAPRGVPGIRERDTCRRQPRRVTLAHLLTTTRKIERIKKIDGRLIAFLKIARFNLQFSARKKKTILPKYRKVQLDTNLKIILLGHLNRLREMPKFFFVVISIVHYYFHTCIQLNFYAFQQNPFVHVSCGTR